MEFGELKPILKAIALPPTGLLLLALLGMLLALRKRIAGLAVSATALAGLWLLGCNGVAVALAHWLLPPVVPVTDRELQGVQAIVVLGGGMGYAPEYGNLQPNPWVLSRLRFTAALARRTGKPVAVSSGNGWGGEEIDEAEAVVYARMLAGDYGIKPRWLESKSRDTRENAEMTAALLRPEGIRRIAVVTDAAHMPRSLRNFREAGFDVVAAPTDFIGRSGTFIYDWLPTARGLRNCHYVLHEWLGARLT
ncbi:YdcF family protein [Ramlibacter albus]|uniref:YdcF family protein n=1 Tax=Ramlibacter albus TaxID=2079448 RepID=A0A923S2Y7_9BURK|nr:YdcF family protein [Ramlibacter albus]MBC5765890.1 YdcF family protein [Ramlibacter albus]